MDTVRTRLRRLRATDFEKMRLLETDPGIMGFTPSRVPQTEEQTRNRIRSQVGRQASLEPFGIWVAEEKGTGAFLGWFMLIPSREKELELGFMLVRSHWGQGFATEVGRLLIDFAKTKGMRRITASTNLDNLASIRVLEKLGLVYERSICVPDKVLGGEAELKSYGMDVG